MEKKCIIVGSGYDLTGRGLGERIDAGEFGDVIRISRRYGETEDVGVRTDVMFTFMKELWDRWCVRQLGMEQPLPYGKLVVMRDLPEALKHDVRLRVRPSAPTTGFYAVYWALENGYKPTIIGFGFVNGVKERNEKVYTNGFVDESKKHNFALEDKYLKKLRREGKIEII